MQIITVNIYDEPTNIRVMVHELPPDQVHVNVIECMSWVVPDDVLVKSNFLGEFATDEEKMQARENLGLQTIDLGLFH